MSRVTDTGVKMKVTRDLKAELVAFFREMKDAYVTKSEQKFDDFLKAKGTEFLEALCVLHIMLT